MSCGKVVNFNDEAYLYILTTRMGFKVWMFCAILCLFAVLILEMAYVTYLADKQDSVSCFDTLFYFLPAASNSECSLTSTHTNLDNVKPSEVSLLTGKAIETGVFACTMLVRYNDTVITTVVY